jgi:hypothetical protein
VHQDRIRTKIEDVFDAMAEIGPTRGNPVSGFDRAFEHSSKRGHIGDVSNDHAASKENGII